ncbi:MAG: hypothetical protein Q8N54_14400 [Sulfurimicrobium sp.]|nr:hypothetical protein [Sulfurimicrobium sp.]
MFEKMLEFLEMGSVGSILGLIGIAMSFYFYIKSLRIPEPRIAFRAEQALTWSDNDEFPKVVEIYFNKEKVPRVARSMVRIWNAGRATLGKELVPEHDRLKLVLENGGVFLGAAILKDTNKASLCKIDINESNPSEALISFDYLDQGDGMIISVLHTDRKAMPSLKGSVKGYKIKTIEDVIKKKLKGHDRWLQPLLTIWLPTIAGSILVIFALWPNKQTDFLRILLLGCYQEVSNHHSFDSRLWNFAIGAIFLGIAGWTLWNNRRRYPKTLTWQGKEGST